MDSNSFHGIIFVVVAILLSSTQGAPILSVDENPSNYSSSATLSCSDATYVSGNGYSWKKNGVAIFNNAGETTTTGKYSGSIDGTTLKLIINDLVAADEDSYLCNHKFFDSNQLDLEVESRGTVTAKLSSSKQIEVTLEKIYPNSTTCVITCGANTVAGDFVSSVEDDGRYTNTWKSDGTYTTLPTSCSAEVTLRTKFNTSFTVISVIVVAVIVGLLWWQIILIVIGIYLPGSFGIGVVVGLIVRKNTKTTIIVVEGDIVTLSCPLTERFTFPEWRGPPSLTTYTNLHDPSGAINPAAPAFERLQYASNKRDLILSDAVVSDSGDYKCSYPEQGDHTITLIVNRGERCKDHVSNNCECKCCACFNIKGLPSWYKILWLSIIGSPVAFGMWVVMKCCGQGKGDKASNVVNTGSHPDEKKKQGRPQPPPPGANHRQLPDIHDRKGRGLSANYTDDAHPLVSINIPTKKPGALESIPDSAREEVTKKRKKKKKKRVETGDDQSD